MDQFAFVNQASNKLQLSVSKGQPEVIRKDAQELISALSKLASLVPEGQEPTDLGRKQAAHGLQLISALAANGMTSLLLDGPQLFPMLAAYMKTPWVTTGVAPIAFAVAYNLIQLNGARLESFVKDGGLIALIIYINVALVANPGAETKEAITQKLNLTLALLYQIGSPKTGLQEVFIAEEGLATVLAHFKTSKSVLIFLSGFIDVSTPPSVIPIIMNHPDFADAVDSMYAEDPDSDDDEEDDDDDNSDAARLRKEEAARTLLVVQVLRNLCLLQGSADTILPLLARFFGHNLSIADEALSALSNLVGTQKIDFRYAWDSSLLGMVLSKATQLCEKMVFIASKDTLAPTNTRNMPARKHIMMRVMQILRNEECLRVAGESTDANRPGHGDVSNKAATATDDANETKSQNSDSDNDDADSDSDSNSSGNDADYEDELVITKDDIVQLIQLVDCNKDLFPANQSWAKVVSSYLALLPASVTWSEANDLVEVIGNTVVERDAQAGFFLDPEFDMQSELGDFGKVRLSVVWRRLSGIENKGNLPKASFDTISQGEIRSSALTTVMAGLARHPIKLATMFKLPASEQSKWSTGPITVNLYDFRKEEKVKVTVDDRVPCYPFSRPIGVWTGSTQTWLPLIEKACAKLLGGYAELPKLTIEQATALLTGTKAIKCKVPTLDLFQTVIESELSENSVMIYTTGTDTPATCLIDSIVNSAEGPSVTAYNPALFDLRRGWDATSGHLHLALTELHQNISSLYKLKLL